MGKILNRYFATLLLASLPLLFGLSGCGDLGCMENRSSIPFAKFYNTKQVAISIDSLTVYGIGQKNDSLLIDSGRSVAQLYLPLRDDKDTTRYVIRYDQKRVHPTLKRDTITFVYKTYPYFASADCGAMFFYDIDTVYSTHNSISSVVLLTPLIDNKGTENLKIIYEAQNSN